MEADVIHAHWVHAGLLLKPPEKGRCMCTKKDASAPFWFLTNQFCPLCDFFWQWITVRYLMTNCTATPSHNARTKRVSPPIYTSAFHFNIHTYIYFYIYQMVVLKLCFEIISFLSESLKFSEDVFSVQLLCKRYFCRRPKLWCYLD